jgi:hypothetical protein
MRVPAASVLQRQHAASQRAMAFSPTALAWLALGMRARRCR